MQTALATQAHLSRIALLEQRTLNIEESAIYRAGIRRQIVSKYGQNLEPQF